MTDTLTRFVRTIILAMLALVGMGMALLFMVSTAIAVGVLYVVAKLRGKRPEDVTPPGLLAAYRSTELLRAQVGEER